MFKNKCLMRFDSIVIGSNNQDNAIIDRTFNLLSKTSIETNSILIFQLHDIDFLTKRLGPSKIRDLHQVGNAT